MPKGFLPATGRLAHLSFPEGVRVDTGVRAGDAISPFYDPMIAKMIAQGPTRGAALREAARGARGDGGGGERHEPRVPEAAGATMRASRPGTWIRG